MSERDDGGETAGPYAVAGPKFYQSFNNLADALALARDRCRSTGNSYYVRTIDRGLANVRMDYRGRVWTDVLEMEGALL